MALTAVVVVDKLVRHWLHSSKYPDFGQCVRRDDSREGGYFVPNLDILAEGEFASRPIRIITNSQGFRNAQEFSHDLPDKTFRLLFMGDSYVAGFRTDQQQIIGYQLQQTLNANSESDFEKHEVMISNEHNPAASWYRYQEHGWKYRPVLPKVDHWFGQFHEIVLGLKKQVSANGSEFLLVLFPTRFQVDQRDWHALTRTYCLDPSKFVLDYPNQRIVESCQQDQISCLDLTSDFRDVIRRRKDRLYMGRGDMHFNVKGQALAAERLGEFVCAMGQNRSPDHAGDVMQAGRGRGQQR